MAATLISRQMERDAAKRWAAQNPLRKWRKEQGWSQEQTAEALGVTNIAVWYWEHGAAQPRRRNLEKLMELVGSELVADWAAWLAQQPEVEW